MKTLNTKTLSLSKTVRVGLTALAMIATFVGCGKKGGDDSFGFNLENCPSCATIAQRPIVIDTMQSTSVNQQQWPGQLSNVQLMVDGSRYYPGTSSTYNNYTGQIAVAGNFITGALMRDSVGQCAMPAGTYTFQTAQVGQIVQGGSMELPDLIVNPGNMHMKFTQGTLYKGNSGETRMYGVLQILAVNGQTCSNFFTNMQ